MLSYDIFFLFGGLSALLDRKTKQQAENAVWQQVLEKIVLRVLIKGKTALYSGFLL